MQVETEEFWIMVCRVSSERSSSMQVETEVFWIIFNGGVYVFKSRIISVKVYSILFPNTLIL